MRDAAKPLPFIQNTPEWLDARRDSIGSSDAPVITGNSQFRSSPFDLWAVKTRLAEPAPVDPMTQEMFDLGHALEPVIAERYEARTDEPLRRRRRTLQHPEVEWATASLDRVRARKGERRIVELKWVPWQRWVEGPEPVPAYVQDQVQWQLFVTGWEVADVAVLNGSHVDVHEIESDPDYQRNLFVIAEAFYENVCTETRPPIDGSEATRRALLRLYPHDDGTPFTPTAELHALMHDWRIAEREAKTAQAELDRLKNTVRGVLEEHSGSESDLWKVTFRRSKDSQRTDWKSVAAAYRQIARDWDVASDALDAIESLHTTTTDGSRSLRVTWKGEEEAWH